MKLIVSCERALIQTGCFRESVYEHCKTAVLTEKILQLLFWLVTGTFGVSGESTAIYLATEEFEHFVLDFGINQWLDS